CGMIFAVNGLKPGSSTTGTLTITNTGTLASTFSLAQPSSATPTASSSEAGHTTLCTDLSLTITDNESGATTGNVYGGSSGLTLVMGSTTAALKSSAGATSWPNNASGVYTFTVTLPSTSPYTDENATCTSTFQVSETNS
ncbi:MAG: hypothetical protein JOY80_02630, partial [Candidatus Dormibacteraeota bacterium]|nr:hypothetical protein [Candidatus Dormibacteraeota bacterium]